MSETDIESLRSFAREIMECWPMGDVDGGLLQDAAVKYGLLAPESRHEPCGEDCNCRSYCTDLEFAEGIICYRKTPLLTGRIS